MTPVTNEECPRAMSAKYIYFENGRDEAPMGFANPAAVFVAWDAEEVAGVFNKMEEAKAAGKWLAGFASYELGYALEPALQDKMPTDRKSPLLCFGVFDGSDALAARGLMHRGREAMGNATLSTPKPVWDEKRYAQVFATVHDYIGAGDIYQANLTFPMTSTWSGEPLGLYAALREAQVVNYGCVSDLGAGPMIVSRSPELFFQVDRDRVIETRPMKGTVPRGENSAEDGTGLCCAKL